MHQLPCEVRAANSGGAREAADRNALGGLPIPGPPPRVTELLAKWGRGEERAFQELIPLVERELHKIARRHMARERDGHTLQPTALVNEACLRLVDARTVTWRDRSHFLAVCARVMRRILVDHARMRRARKRGGSALSVAILDGLELMPERRHDFVALDDALEALARVDVRKSRVVELRFFGGLTVEETAAVVNVSPDTVMRDWRLARAWLRRELRAAQPTAGTRGTALRRRTPT